MWRSGPLRTIGRLQHKAEGKSRQQRAAGMRVMVLHVSVGLSGFRMWSGL